MGIIGADTELKMDNLRKLVSSEIVLGVPLFHKGWREVGVIVDCHGDSILVFPSYIFPRPYSKSEVLESFWAFVDNTTPEAVGLIRPSFDKIRRLSRILEMQH